MMYIFFAYFLFMYCKIKVVKNLCFLFCNCFFVARKPMMTMAKHGQPCQRLMI